MFENILEIKRALIETDLPKLQFDGEITHPLLIIIIPTIIICMIPIFFIFTLLAIFIDICNLFVKDKQYEE